MASKYPTLERLEQWIDGAAAPFAPRDEVEKFLKVEKAHHAADLNDLAHVLLATQLTAAATDRLRRVRAAARFATLREATETYAQSVTDGVTRPGMFATFFAVDEANTRKPVSQMTGKDHQFVAGRYLSDAKVSQLEAAFHKAVAKRVGRSATGEVMNEETYEELYRSIVGPPRADAA